VTHTTTFPAPISTDARLSLKNVEAKHKNVRKAMTLNVNAKAALSLANTVFILSSESITLVLVLVEKTHVAGYTSLRSGHVIKTLVSIALCPSAVQQRFCGVSFSF